MIDILEVSSQHRYGVEMPILSTPKWAMAPATGSVLYRAMLQERIRKNIVALREAKGWKRPDLAKRVKPATSPQQIERLEKGDRKLTIDWVEKLAGALGVDPYQLILDSDLPADPGNLRLDGPVADEVARSFARVALGAEPEDSLVTNLSIMLRELVETFLDHPATRRDPQQARPVIDLLERRLARQ